RCNFHLACCPVAQDRHRDQLASVALDVIGDRKSALCGLPIYCQNNVAALQTGARSRAVFKHVVDLRASRLKWNLSFLYGALDGDRNGFAFAANNAPLNALLAHSAKT